MNLSSNGAVTLWFGFLRTETMELAILRN